MITYLFIFILKIIENTIGTLRLIVVANGKKKEGAILNFIIAIVWIISTSLVVNDLKQDPIKIIVFALGSLVGSYLGSYLEEKIAFGNNLLILKSNKINTIKKILKKLNYEFNIINKNTIIIILKRKERKHIIKILKHFDNDINIISQTAKELNLKTD